MTVQTSPGLISVGPGDFQRTDRGVTWAIKFRDMSGTQVVLILIKQADGGWTVDPLPEAQLDSKFDLRVSEPGFSIDTWVTDVILTRLNAWLAKRFPATGDATIPLFDQAESVLLSRLMVVVGPSGELSATLRP